MRALLQLLLLRIRLFFAFGPVVAFDVPSLGGLQFIKPVIAAYRKTHPSRTILFVHQGNTSVESVAEILGLDADRSIHVSRAELNKVRLGGIDLFITPEQYDLGICGTYSVAMFHGHAAKGLSFVPSIVEAFDGFFLNGPIHRQAFETFLADFNDGLPSDKLDLFNVGYPKSDDLLNGVYDVKDVACSLGLNPDKKTVLYAPAFNEGASLREFGPELIEILACQSNYNVLVKLPVDCWAPTSCFYATGGIDWFDVIQRLEKTYANLRLFKEYQIDPLLACADVLVTCISSVGFEFMALDKPVVFIETPKFFTGYLKKVFPDKDTKAWARRTSANGGKEFGLVVEEVGDLPAAIDEVLRNPGDYPRQKERLQSHLLYNRGHASVAAVSTIDELVGMKVKSRRECRQPGVFGAITGTVWQRLAGGILDRFRGGLARILQRRGYTLTKTGQGYLSAENVVAAARSHGLSICEYRESQEDHPRKIGRRDRIIQRMQEAGVFQSVQSVCEIGAGTGVYLEKVLFAASPNRYEIYETDVGWVKFLEGEYSDNTNCTLRCHPCDGRSLDGTSDNTIDLVHAHGVFVYIPLLQSLSYLLECIRVCKPGGYIVFDCYLDSTFDSVEKAAPWLSGVHHWPVVIPRQLLDDLVSRHQLSVVAEFVEIHASGTCDYFVWKKCGTNGKGAAK